MSTEPIVFWGPGSEWFWIFAQFVVVAVTLFGIYFQFRLQRAANAFDQISRLTADGESEPMLRAKLRVARAVAAGDLPPEGAMSVIGNYWETVASLVRGGHVSAKDLYESVGSSAPFWWAAIADGARDLRRRRHDAAVFQSFEWLAETFTGIAIKRKEPFPFDHETIVEMCKSGTPGIEDRIRMAEESRVAPEPPERPAARARRPAASR